MVNSMLFNLNEDLEEKNNLALSKPNKSLTLEKVIRHLS